MLGETTIDILRREEIKTVAITLEEYPDFYEISIPCDEEQLYNFLQKA